MIENGDVTENGNIENAKVTYFIFSFHYLLLELYRLLKNFQRFKLLSPKTSVNKKNKKPKKKIHSKLETSKKEKKKTRKEQRKKGKSTTETGRNVSVMPKTERAAVWSFISC